MVLRTKSVVLLPLSVAARSIVSFSFLVTRKSSLLSRTVSVISYSSGDYLMLSIVRLIAVQSKLECSLDSRRSNSVYTPYVF
jgi:hypothetical protein